MMASAYDDVRARRLGLSAIGRHVTLREAAHAIAVERVVEASRLTGKM